MKIATIAAEDLAEIARIGHLRKPVEACGFILPTPHRNRRVWEMPNRAKEPDTYLMVEHDIELSIGEWFGADTEPYYDQIVVWHTHPSGNAAPSQDDINNRLEDCCNLVVALSDDGQVAPAFF